MEDWDRIWQTAWARYVSAALLIWFAIWFAQQDANGKHWWLPVAAFIYALIRAREISIGVLVLGGIYLIFHGIAAPGKRRGHCWRNDYCVGDEEVDGGTERANALPA